MLYDAGPEGDPAMKFRIPFLASTGLVATMTFSGHWHRNDTTPDAAGTIHYLLGENWPLQQLRKSS